MPVDCYSCANPAINACKRCAKPYCEDHGNAQYCAGCLHPASALPSFNLYRGALLTMLVGTAAAVILIVRPPGEPSGASPVIVGRTAPTPTAAGGTPEATVAARTPQTSPTPSAPTATAVPTRAPFIEYIVEEGDSLFLIAQEHVPAGDDVVAYVNAIANLNGLDPNNPSLSVGQKLLLPPAP